MVTTRRKSYKVVLVDGPQASDQAHDGNSMTASVSESVVLRKRDTSATSSIPVKKVKIEAKHLGASATSPRHRLAGTAVPRTPKSESVYGLIQEQLQDNLYFLLVQAILWNQTTGKQARPVLDALLALYPTPDRLAQADLAALTALLQPIGLHNRRAARLIAFATVWVQAPPCKERRYRKVGYPHRQSGKDVKPAEVLAEDDPREGWEIAHLPGMGPYALDSYRIFHRDKLRGRSKEQDENFEPEWKRVKADDKELRAWLIWRWQKEGWSYNALTGERTRASAVKVEPDAIATPAIVISPHFTTDIRKKQAKTHV